MGAKNLNEERLGIVKTMSNGMKCKCIEYNNCQDIKVQYENGVIVSGTWSNFQRGTIGTYELRHESLVGSRNKMNCGLIAELIEYEMGGKRIVIKFDGISTVKISSYTEFRLGCCFPRFEVGTIFRLSDGSECIIIEMEQKSGGTAIKYKHSNGDFIYYAKSIKILLDIILGNKKPYLRGEDNLNVSVRQKNGMLAKCVGVELINGRKRYSIQYEDGTIKSGVSFSVFLRGDANYRVYTNQNEVLNDADVKVLRRCRRKSRLYVDCIHSNNLVIDVDQSALVSAIMDGREYYCGTQFKFGYKINGISYYIGKIDNERICDTYEGIKRRLSNESSR